MIRRRFIFCHPSQKPAKSGSWKVRNCSCSEFAVQPQLSRTVCLYQNNLEKTHANDSHSQQRILGVIGAVILYSVVSNDPEGG